MTGEATHFDITQFAQQVAKQIPDELRGLIASEQTKDWYTSSQLAAALTSKQESEHRAVTDLRYSNKDMQMIDRQIFFEKDHVLIFGTNLETGLGEVRIVRGPMTKEEMEMRNLCINMILEAGCESSLMDVVHDAAEILGTPKQVLDSIIAWAGFEPDPN
jgi:hypothetical protein